jgi:hypothetical protein
MDVESNAGWLAGHLHQYNTEGLVIGVTVHRSHR